MEVTHLLDYGCGAKCRLASSLKIDHKITYQAYDPAVKRFSKEPMPAQMVACVDVLEHIEPEYLESVLDDLARLAEGIAFISVDTGPAIKVLDDGRNAHLIQQPIEWWLPKFTQRFDLETVQKAGEHSYFFLGTSKVHMEYQNGEKIV